VLANECTSYKEGFIEGKHDIEIFDKEKFAELIVRECIDAIDAARPYHTNDHLVNDYMNGVEHGHKFAITMIRKHFGVEE
jgi:hypothetical protein